MKETEQPEQPRITVSRMKDSKTGEYWLRGIEIADRDRANVFGQWQKWAEDEPLRDDFDHEGQYFPAGASCQIGVEVEVRFAFSSVADDDIYDCAEAYIWDVYNWNLTDDGLVCEKDEDFWGDYVYGHGPIYYALIFDPIIAAAVRRIHDARFNGVEHAPGVVGSGE